MTNETLPQDSQLDALTAESEQDGGESVEPSISLADLNAQLGKEFKDKETALKSLKDTQSFVGKKVETKVDPTIQEQLDNLQAELKDSNFYRDNPQYNNETTKKLIQKMGKNPEEVVNDEVFKEIYNKTSAYDKSQESKSVLHNSSRLGQASTKMDDATAHLEKAMTSATPLEAQKNIEKAQEDAVSAVIDSIL